jgi:hypothetical protein
MLDCTGYVLELLGTVLDSICGGFGLSGDTKIFSFFFFLGTEGPFFLKFMSINKAFSLSNSSSSASSSLKRGESTALGVD